MCHKTKPNQAILLLLTITFIGFSVISERFPNRLLKWLRKKERKKERKVWIKRKKGKVVWERKKERKKSLNKKKERKEK